MKPHIRFIVITLVIVLGLIMGVNLTPAQGYSGSTIIVQASIPSHFPWSSQYVQRQLNLPLDTAGYISAAISSFNDYFLISYYDTTHHSLIAATPIANHAGNCGTDLNWMCVPIDGGIGLDAGMYSSVDIWGTSLDYWKMGFSYYDVTHRALKAAIYTCYLGACSWDKVTVSAPDVPEKSNGLYTSFKFNSAGTPSIAYFDINTTYMNSSLEYAYQVTSGGDCGAGEAVGLWECKDVDFLSGEGRYASLDFSYDDQPYIAFYDAHEGDLKVAYHSAINMCEFGWTCPTLDGMDGSDVGYFTSLVAPQSAGDVIRIAYHDKTNGKLKYYASDWGPVVVDDMGTSISPMGISMAMDKEGYPIIAYQQISSEFSPPELRIARPNSVYGDEEYGNCGDPPPGYLFQYWRCNTLDNASQYTAEANYAALIINSRGMLAIAYSEYDSYYNATSLKFTYQTLIKTFLPSTVRQ